MVLSGSIDCFFIKDCRGQGREQQEAGQIIETDSCREKHIPSVLYPNSGHAEVVVKTSNTEFGPSIAGSVDGALPPASCALLKILQTRALSMLQRGQEGARSHSARWCLKHLQISRQRPR